MKYFIIIMVFMLSITFGYAQSMNSGYFVVPNPALDESVQDQLGNKIKTALSKADVIATDAYFPMVTIVKYDEIETIEIEGMRKMFKTIGTVSIIVTFTNTNTALAAEEFDVQGVGANKTISQATAVKNIKISSATIKKMMEKAKSGYEEALNSFTSGKVTNAKKLKAQRYYIDALDELSEIPSDSKNYIEASKMIKEIEKLLEKEAKEQQKVEELRAQREFELQQQQLKNQKEIAIEYQKTKQTAINARARVVERYYRAWQAYYSGR